MNNIYVGWDSREDIAYQVCKYSLSKDVIPLKQQELRDRGLYWRDIDKLGSTEFTFTRFMVPLLNDYKGWALFCDCDILFLDNVSNLFARADSSKAVMVAKHDYTPKEGLKMDGQQQHVYPRKNWSSVILWNCAHPSNRVLTTEIVNEQSGSFLHRFEWLKDEEIGEFSYEWNYLVGWYKEGNPKALHYTEGGPWFENYRNCEYSDVWKRHLRELYK